jgi:phosphatidic acid-selective phospholipase A1
MRSRLILSVITCLLLNFKCKGSDQESHLKIPGIDADLMKLLLTHHNISDPELQQRLSPSFQSMTVKSSSLFHDWISDRDDEIAYQFISESKSKSKRLLKLCPNKSDCRKELDGVCFGGKRMSHLCRTAEPTSLISPELLVQRQGDNSSYWISIDSSEEIIKRFFSGTKSVVIVIHGFRQSYRDVSSIHDALVEAGEQDVVVTLDYKFAARPANYARALVNSEIVAYKLSKFIRKSMKALSISGSDFYLIGFSMGTQVAHFAAGFLAQEDILLDRITGLDPSAVMTKGIRLSHEDASFVDVIHTSASSIIMWPLSYLMGKVGIREPMGHVDFYPNGGGFQPSCRNYLFSLNFGCNHLTAIKYFASSIRSCPYHSYPCKTVPNSDTFYDRQCREPDDERFASRMGYYSYLTHKKSIWTSQLLYTSYKQPYCETKHPCKNLFSCTGTLSRYTWPE